MRDVSRLLIYDSRSFLWFKRRAVWQSGRSAPRSRGTRSAVGGFGRVHSRGCVEVEQQQRGLI